MLTHYWIRAIRPAGVEGRGGEEGIFIHTAFYQKTEASRNVFFMFSNKLRLYSLPESIVPTQQQ